VPSDHTDLLTIHWSCRTFRLTSSKRPH